MGFEIFFVFEGEFMVMEISGDVCVDVGVI